MGTDSTYAVIELDDFVRRFSMRKGGLMWLLGAGTSAAAGIPTAWDMIWEFKQQLYVSQKRVSPKTVGDLSNPSIRTRLQSYIDESGKYAAADSPEEYADLFEAAYPSEADRRTYIDGKLSGAKPSYGHLALATLMKAQFTKVVWTTNFDALVADACAKVYDSTGNLTSVSLDATDLAQQVIGTERWPAEIKLHGDFRSRRLKNTSDELREQDARLRKAMIELCSRSGLVVAGYSGRDDSIMKSLSEAVGVPDAFPNGLFWLHRGDSDPLPSVISLLKEAKEAKIDGGLVRIESFDETLRDVIRLIGNLDTGALDTFAEDRRIWTPAIVGTAQKGFPVIRLNGIRLAQIPTACRRVECAIGGFSDVSRAVAESGLDVIATRTQAGVLAFGSDSDVTGIFAPYGIKAFDLHSIETRRLRYDSGERGLLREALSRAIATRHDMLLLRKRGKDLLMPRDITSAQWAPLRKLVGQIAGTMSRHPGLKWWEGIAIRLDWASDHLWLLTEPRTVFEGVTDENRALSTDFARERTVRRYNRQLNDLVAFWTDLLFDGGNEVRALGIGNGIDAAFKLDKTNSFSRRVGGV